MSQVANSPARSRLFWPMLLTVVLTALITLGLAALLVNIIERKNEAKEHNFEIASLSEEVVDPEVWGRNFPRQYDGWRRTVDNERSQHGGSEALPPSKLEADPRLTRIFAGYAFSVDYREKRGHAFMLHDQEQTERVKQFKQPGACLHCHASIVPAFRFAGSGDIMKGFEKVCAMPYAEAHDLVDAKGEKLVKHPVACIDCHDPKSMQLRVTRPGFLNGIQALVESDVELPHLASIVQWRKDRKSGRVKEGERFDPNVRATRQEMRSFVCGQCHVEYYFKGPGKLLTYPWHKGLKADQIESYYSETGFTDWVHKETQAPVLKAQHPEFEMWNQGIHARSGVACADCHMPYQRVGAVKVSDHQVRSPMLQVNRSCQTCHRFDEDELKARVETIQKRTRDLAGRAEDALTQMMDAINEARKNGATADKLKPAQDLHRRAQWRVDFVLSENSSGFHAPQEAARLLAEAIDFARQAQIAAMQAAGKTK
jgi:nitrite reductase (cytochrome c-552)